VHKDAQRSDAYQANRNLLLSDKARADSIPASRSSERRSLHARRDRGPGGREQLFYLRSRGLPRPDAERISSRLLRAGAGAHPAESLRTAVTAAVERKAAA